MSLKGKGGCGDGTPRHDQVSMVTFERTDLFWVVPFFYSFAFVFIGILLLVSPPLYTAPLGVYLLFSSLFCLWEVVIVKPCFILLTLILFGACHVFY